MSHQQDYENAVEYFSRYGCSSWGEDKGNPNCSGWLVSDFDTIHKCPLHYKGQPHPYDYEQCYSEADYFVEEHYANFDKEFKAEALQNRINFLTEELEIHCKQEYQNACKLKEKQCTACIIGWGVHDGDCSTVTNDLPF